MWPLVVEDTSAISHTDIRSSISDFRLRNRDVYECAPPCDFGSIWPEGILMGGTTNQIKANIFSVQSKLLQSIQL